RVMDSQGKLKIGYLAFPVDRADANEATGTLTVVPRQSGFALAVHNTGAFTDATTHETRPAVGTQVGSLAATTACVAQEIPLTGVQVHGGHVYLAVTTTSPYELEITSTEGSSAAAETDAAPTLVLDGEVATTPPPTTQPTPPPTT